MARCFYTVKTKGFQGYTNHSSLRMARKVAARKTKAFGYDADVFENCPQGSARHVFHCELGWGTFSNRGPVRCRVLGRRRRSS